MSDIFTTRETAIIIWIGIITIYVLFKKQTRASIINIIRIILKTKILLSIFFYLFYFSVIVYFFYHVEWWDISNLKDTIIWFIFSGLPIGFVVATKKLERGFWKTLILDNLKLMVLVEFIINSFTFSLVIEFFFILPFATMVTTLNAFSKHDEEYKNVGRLTNVILMLFGFAILFYSLYRAIIEINSIENIDTLRSILFPAVYSIISVPYMYILKLYVDYENNAIIRKYNSPLSEGSVKSENVKTRPTWITLKTPQEITSANKISSKTTLHFSDSKKEELVGYMTELYDAKEVKVNFISPSNTSSNGLMYVDYYIDITPTRTDLNNNLANIVILSESLAEESGISNPNVSVCAMTMEGIPLGVRNYYSSTGKAFIDVSDCPEV
jgi:hypothetical protein